MKKFNYYSGIFYASSILTIIIILAEFLSPLKSFLASIFSHHWIGKIVLTAVIFLIFGFLYKDKKLFGALQEKAAWYATLGSLIAIFIFYIIHFFI